MKNHKYTQELFEELKKYYPTKGKMWCANILNLSEGQVRYLASKLKLKFDQTSDFFKEWQERAAKSKVGKKLSEEHRKKLSIAIRASNPKTIFNKECIICHKKYIVHGTAGTQYKTKTCGGKQCICSYQKILKKNQWSENNPHPKGFKGHKHSLESRKIMSLKSKQAWEDKNSGFYTKEFKKLKGENMRKIILQRLKNGGNVYSRAKKAWVTIGDKTKFYRSSWEVVYAKYLEWLKQRKEILNWDYETKTFWFEKIKRGVRSYTPDFEVTNNNGSIEFHEVKGWMDKKSKTKLSRMKIYYPKIKLILIDEPIFKEIKKFENLFDVVEQIKVPHRQDEHVEIIIK